MSYTKGPWRDEGEVWATFIATRGDGTQYHDNAIIAIVRDSNKLSEDEKEANAHLIAAAPELLEALKDCYRALIAQGCHLDKQMPLSERLDVAKKAQEVIAKAEGRTE